MFHQLFLFGFFFAMRSCENYKVSGERRTHSIRKRNIAVIKLLPHNSPDLELAFEYQKRDERNDATATSFYAPSDAPQPSFADSKPWVFTTTLSSIPTRVIHDKTRMST
jgi:hypothetical protein